MSGAADGVEMAVTQAQAAQEPQGVPTVRAAQGSPLDRIFDPDRIEAIYQPIVGLATGQVAGFEALARWPSLDVTPDVAFAHARRERRVGELDSLCQRAALDGARRHGLPAGFKLFVNVEPGHSVTSLTHRSEGQEVIAEITERALLSDPGELLRSIDALRHAGCGIALDDVGAVPASLAILPVVAPDVVKLDLSLIQRWPDPQQSRILGAVAAYAERTGATVLAEGIETEEHQEQAFALGATLGQGWLFARPGPLGEHREPLPFGPLPRPRTPRGDTPFGLLDPRTLRVGSKGLLLRITRHVEEQGRDLATPPLVLSAFQTADRFTPATARRYQQLAARSPLVVAFGTGMPPAPAPGVRGGPLSEDDPLAGEWTVAVLGSHYAAALIARDLGDGGPDLQRRYLFSLTHDYETVVGAADALIRRTGHQRPTP